MEKCPIVQFVAEQTPPPEQRNDRNRISHPGEKFGKWRYCILAYELIFLFSWLDPAVFCHDQVLGDLQISVILVQYWKFLTENSRRHGLEMDEVCLGGSASTLFLIRGTISLHSNSFQLIHFDSYKLSLEVRSTQATMSHSICGSLIHPPSPPFSVWLQ